MARVVLDQSIPAEPMLVRQPRPNLTLELDMERLMAGPEYTVSHVVWMDHFLGAPEDGLTRCATRSSGVPQDRTA